MGHSDLKLYDDTNIDLPFEAKLLSYLSWTLLIVYVCHLLGPGENCRRSSLWFWLKKLILLVVLWQSWYWSWTSRCCFCLYRNQFFFQYQLVLILGSFTLLSLGFLRMWANILTVFWQKNFPSSHFQMDLSPLAKILEDSPSIVGRRLDVCNLVAIFGLPKLQPHRQRACWALVGDKSDRPIQV